MEPRIRVGGLFFDSEPVIQALSEDERKVLSRVGFFVMKDARQSIRSGRKPSRPGRPPTDHTKLLKRFISFAYDLDAKSVVSGAEPLKGTRSRGQVPEALEEGGTTYNVQAGKRIRIEPRPFMGPAFDRQLSKPLPPPWGK